MHPPEHAGGAESDEALALRAQDNDRDAFGELVRRYEQKLARYGRKFLRTAEDREDLLQEIFLKAYTNIQSFDPSRRFSPWLYRIAHNEYVNALRRMSRQPILSFDFDTLFPHPEAEEQSDRESMRAELSKEMEMCLSELAPKYREPIVLYFFEELSYQEIADVLRIPIVAVGVRITRGKKKLRVLYEKKYGRT